MTKRAKKDRTGADASAKPADRGHATKESSPAADGIRRRDKEEEPAPAPAAAAAEAELEASGASHSTHGGDPERGRLNLVARAAGAGGRGWAAPGRRGYTVSTAVQTDASFVPSALSLQDHLGELSTRHWLTLKCLKEGVVGTVTSLAGSLYDFLAFKNIAATLPGMGYASGSPLTDLILLTSKLHRVVSLLTRQLSAFFDIVFSEGISDELLHFTEMRLTKKKLIDVTAELEEARSEVANLQARVRSLESREVQQRQALEKLEATHGSMEIKSAALEEQMAVLFEQLADDYIYYNEDELRQAQEDSRVHERLAPVRSAFSHSIDAVLQRLRHFQDMLAEISVEPAVRDGTDADLGSSPPSGRDRVKGEKSKLKSLEVHLHHLTSRFNAVREGLHQTAKDLHTALADKRKILNLSVQHLKAYELQNAKLQNVRARLCDTRRSLSLLSNLFRRACPRGTALAVDQQGSIVLYARGGEEATAADASLDDLYAALQNVQADTDAATDVATSSDEHRQLMKIVALSVPSASSKRETALAAAKEASPDAAAASTVGASGSSGEQRAAKMRQQTKQVSEALQQSREATVAQALVAEHGLQGEPDEMGRIKDSNGRVVFMRDVYEDRVKTLETKVDMLLKKLIAGGSSPDEVWNDEDIAVLSKRKWLARRDEMLSSGTELAKKQGLMKGLRDARVSGNVSTRSSQVPADDAGDGKEGPEGAAEEGENAQSREGWPRQTPLSPLPPEAESHPPQEQPSGDATAAPDTAVLHDEPTPPAQPPQPSPLCKEPDDVD